MVKLERKLEYNEAYCDFKCSTCNEEKEYYCFIKKAISSIPDEVIKCIISLCNKTDFKKTSKLKNLNNTLSSDIILKRWTYMDFEDLKCLHEKILKLQDSCCGIVDEYNKKFTSDKKNIMDMLKDYSKKESINQSYESLESIKGFIETDSFPTDITAFKNILKNHGLLDCILFH